jgi:alkylation response protein AidB-like acyl-CoA dehydrogenase
VRTDPDAHRHKGISLVLVPADADGLEIRPVKQINRKNEFAEVFFNDVIVPLDRVVGPLNGGWQVAMSVLAFERGAEMAFGRLGEAQPGFEATLRALRGRSELDQAAFAAEAGRLQAGYFAFQVNAMRLLAGQLEGGSPNELASVSRLQAAETFRHATTEQLAMLGPDVLASHDAGWHHFEDYLSSRSATIAAGTSEIQRNIIARRILGMG